MVFIWHIFEHFLKQNNIYFIIIGIASFYCKKKKLHKSGFYKVFKLPVYLELSEAEDAEAAEALEISLL